MSAKNIYALFNDDDILMDGLKKAMSKGLYIKEVYSPFPVHGIEKVLGVKWTNIAIASFIYGMTGLTLAVLGMYYFMIQDWPMNIGGKPNFSLFENLPAFIPIAFEFAVLCAAHGMAITYLLLNKTYPGAKARNPHPRTTDDHFAVEIIPAYNTKFTKEQIAGIMKESGAVEVFEK